MSEPWTWKGHKVQKHLQYFLVLFEINLSICSSIHTLFIRPKHFYSLEVAKAILTMSAKPKKKEINSTLRFEMTPSFVLFATNVHCFLFLVPIPLFSFSCSYSIVFFHSSEASCVNFCYRPYGLQLGSLIRTHIAEVNSV